MPDLGTKHECTSCGTKFYDLGKDEPVCPKCGLNQLAEEEEEPAADEAAEEEAQEAPVDKAKQAPAKTEAGDDKGKKKLPAD